MPENAFDERIAKRYDQRWPETWEPAVVEPMVDLLAQLAAPGPALEFAVGTGRVALPLSALGIRVDGIELSPDMVHELQKKPGSEEIGVNVGDMATTKLNESYRLVYLVANTIMNLTTQEEQVACLVKRGNSPGAGRTLSHRGHDPRSTAIASGRDGRAHCGDTDARGIEEYDAASQIAYSHHWWNQDGRLESFSAPFRHVWPSELDLMARIAGMSLRDRWGGWGHEPFTSESTKHVSVWEKSS